VATAQYTERELGFPTRAIENPITNVVSTSAVEILRANPDRFQWLVVNLSANTIYVSFDKDVSSTKGILLEPNGGFASMHAREDGEAVTYPIWAIATGVNSAIYVIEYERR